MKQGRIEDVLDWLKPGQNVYIQGGPGECSALIDLLKTNPGAGKGVTLWSCLIPGINSFDYGSLPDGPNLVTFMASPALEPSIATGRTQLRPKPYSAIGEELSRTDFDLAILHTAEPEKVGYFGFGICCDAPGIVWPRAKKRVAFLNARMPDIWTAEGISHEDVDLGIYIDTPLIGPGAARPPSPALQAIARNAASLVPDGATIQSGIGEAPGAIVAALKSHRGLKAFSGVVTSEYRQLVESEALAPTHNLAGIAWGDAEFYSWLYHTGPFAFRSILKTHDRAAIAAIPNFVSIGSALEVDLSGALNLEWAGGRRVSSVGGAPDYIHGAAQSPGGFSIIALPSVTRSGVSRIVRRLENPSVAAGLADVIITEHGVARLRGLDKQARAKAIISIADPLARESLARAAD